LNGEAKLFSFLILNARAIEKAAEARKKRALVG
jgi:hypothetical protein